MTIDTVRETSESSATIYRGSMAERMEAIRQLQRSHVRTSYLAAWLIAVRAVLVSLFSR